MRLAYILPGFCANENDWCIPVVTSLVREMAARADVVVYTPHYPYRRESYRLHGALVRCLSDHKRNGVGRLLLWRDVVRAITEDHRERPFDAIHGLWANETGLLATLAGDRLGVPSVVSLAGGELARVEMAGYGAQFSRLGRRIVERSLARATSITAGSPWLLEKLPARHRAKGVAIPLGVDVSLFPPTRERTGTRLLAAASLIKLKDYRTILRAVAIARNSIPSITLDIAGVGVDHLELLSLAHGLGLYGAVRFLGFVAFDEMASLYRSHDLFLHASHYEAQGMVVLEALATGMPVVASNVGIVPSLPSDLVRSFDPGDAERMAQLIVESLSDHRHARAAALDGPSLVTEEYSVEVACDHFMEVYERGPGGAAAAVRMAVAESNR